MIAINVNVIVFSGVFMGRKVLMAEIPTFGLSTALPNEMSGEGYNLEHLFSLISRQD
jgi:hypothetical protein